MLNCIHEYQESIEVDGEQVLSVGVEKRWETSLMVCGLLDQKSFIQVHGRKAQGFQFGNENVRYNCVEC